MNEEKNEIEIAKKKKILLQMKKELEELEQENKHKNIINLKIRTIRSIKLNIQRAKLLAPFTLTLILTTEAFKISGAGYPFIRDEKKEYLNVITKIDEEGNIIELKQFEPIDNNENIANIYTKWNFKDNTYTRRINIYELKENTTLSNIEEAISNNSFKIEDYIQSDRIISQKTETTQTPKLIKNNMKELLFYTKDLNNYKTKKESTRKNVLVSIIYIMILESLEFYTEYLRSNYSKYKYKDKVEEIKVKYKPLNKEILAKKLEIKKENYNRLKGPQDE